MGEGEAWILHLFNLEQLWPADKGRVIFKNPQVSRNLSHTALAAVTATAATDGQN